MPPGHRVEGIEAAHSIRKKHPGIGVVVLSQHSDAAYAVQLLKDGTEGLAYLLKTRVGELDELLHALREVVAGRSVVDSGVVERLVDYRSRQTESPLRLLSEREVEVLREMAEGKSNSSIASSLHLSESSVEKYVNTIFSKLGLSEERLLSRRVAAVLAYLGQPLRGANGATHGSYAAALFLSLPSLAFRPMLARSLSRIGAVVAKKARQIRFRSGRPPNGK